LAAGQYKVGNKFNYLEHCRNQQHYQMEAANARANYILAS
jgi:hypothetical protein